jgi:hypothetical protein
MGTIISTALPLFAAAGKLPNWPAACPPTGLSVHPNWLKCLAPHLASVLPQLA